MFNGISHVVEIWIFVGLGIMVILFLTGMMARLYRKAGPNDHYSLPVHILPSDGPFS